jgi:hypothetical protein
MTTMKSVLRRVNVIVLVGYILAGIFGYATFARYADLENIMNAQNLLKAPY